LVTHPLFPNADHFKAYQGSGAWTEDGSAMGKFPNDLWAQTAVGGTDGKTIHAIWNASGTSTTFSKCGQNVRLSTPLNR